MKLEALTGLPDWPALMSAAVAGAYLGMSASSFEVLAARRGLRRVKLDVRCTRWRRRDVDALIEGLPFVQADEREAEPAAEPDAFNDEEAAALARVASYGRRSR